MVNELWKHVVELWKQVVELWKTLSEVSRLRLQNIVIFGFHVIDGEVWRLRRTGLGLHVIDGEVWRLRRTRRLRRTEI